MSVQTQSASATSILAETIRIDVYFDYACPFAWAAQVWLDQVKEELGDQLDINWRIFPLEQVNHMNPDYKVWEQPNDGTSSTLRSFQAFHAAKQQGDEAFKRMHAELFRKRHVDGRNLGRQQVLESAAESAGLDLERFRADLDSDAVFADVERDYTQGLNEHAVFGTPTIVFENGATAYLKLNFRELPPEPVKFFEQFVSIVRDQPEVMEIKRP